MVQYLCEQGADKEARGYGNKTPLHEAARSGHFSAVQSLCEKGVDKDAEMVLAGQHRAWQQREAILFVVISVQRKKFLQSYIITTLFKSTWGSYFITTYTRSRPYIIILGISWFKFHRKTRRGAPY